MLSKFTAFFVLLLLSSMAAFACSDHETEQCVEVDLGLYKDRKCACVWDPSKGPPPINPVEVFTGVATLRTLAGITKDQTLTAAVQNIEEIEAKLDKETRTAINNAFNNPAQAVRDVIQTHVKAANDLADAVSASARYAERAVSGYGDVVSQAEKRLREGKVVDAVWHLSTDKLSSDNANAAQLMQESEVARQAAQTVAGSYGGPAGTAAFAAWYAYNQTKGDVGAALRAGAYSYLVSKGYASVGKMPSGTVDHVARKVAATAAVKGLAVAAAGGNQDDILRAAAEGGGSVIVQSGQAYVTKEYVDPARAKADAFCMNAVNKSCAEAKQWVGDTRVRLEQYRATADNLRNVAATEDKDWLISYDRKALMNRMNKSPGVVLTYIGEGSPYRRELLRIAAIGDPARFAVPVMTSSNWVAFRSPGDDAPFFENETKSKSLSVSVGDQLKAKTSVNVRASVSPEMWRSKIDIVQPGQKIKVLEVKPQPKVAQEWIRFERVQ